MSKFIEIKKNEYYDSVTLMSLSAEIERKNEGCQLLVAMATKMNIDLLSNMGFDNNILDELTNNDLVIAVNGVEEENYKEILNQVKEKLNGSNNSLDKKADKVYSTIGEAVKDKDYNLGVISLPGKYAYLEARKLLDNDINVMLFSDNMTIEEEVELKKYALSKNLLVMGPDCGTSIINNKGICFANSIKKGNIGIVAASGTGLQEVSVLIDKLGGGISQAIGVGGRDLSKEVGGLMMLSAIEALEKDINTEKIVLVSKPPMSEVKEKIMKALEKVTKQVVIYFIDAYEESRKDNIIFAKNLYDTAYKAVKFKEDNNISEEVYIKDFEFSQNQKYIRGLFCGGTLCLEALSVLRDNNFEVYSNISKHEWERLENPQISKANSVIDLGDDFFTNGKPHPMIEPSIRLEKIIDEAKDKETKVILMDFEIGYGSHEDPVGVTLDYIYKAKDIAKDNNCEIAFVGYVLGTNTDPQGLEKQEKMLKDAGVIVANSNIEAINIAMRICGGVNDGIIEAI